MTAALFVLLLMRGGEFVGHHSATFATLEECTAAGRAMPKHKFTCIRVTHETVHQEDR